MQDALYEEMWRMEQTHWWFTARRQIVTTLASRYLANLKGRRWKICELGCGTGGNLESWADQHDVIGVEPSPEAMRFARQRLGHRVQQGSLPNQVDLPANQYDLVVLTDVFEHVEQDRQAALTAIHLVRPGGILVATVPAYQWLYSPRDEHHQHFRRYGKAEFRRLLTTSTSSIELLSHYNTSLFPPAAAVRLWSKLTQRESEGGDLRLPPRLLNRMLHGLFACERWFLPWVSFPFGLSLVAIVRREASVPAKRAA